MNRGVRSMKSSEMKPKAAVKAINKCATTDELNALIEGEDREDVLAAAAGKAEKLKAGDTGGSDVQPLSGRTWVYHEEHAPKIIEGSDWPAHAVEGWQLDQSGFERPWKMNDKDGSFSKE